MLTDNAEKSRFELTENGALAFADYRRGRGRLILTHFETEPAARGTGQAGRLMAAIADHARDHDLKIDPQCPYAIAWFDKHPETAAELRVEAVA